MRHSIILLFLLLTFSSTKAQTENPKTILYLIPFYTEEIKTFDVNFITFDEDINNITSFKLAGFWEGAEMAFREFENEGFKLNVIVRDITDDKKKLNQILQDTTFMKGIDLIIGPFFAEMFTIAAQYANTYKIPIVNPFSNRTDFVENNEYVYKLIPSISARPILLDSLLLNRYPKTNIILWGNIDNSTNELSIYEDYFIKKQLPYTKVPFREGITLLMQKMKPNYHNIIITYSETQASIIHNIRLLANTGALPSYSLVIPEEWLKANEAETENFNKLNIHYFSNYYVDYENDNTLLFVSDFIERFNSPPDLSRFSFQGYDITRYFVNKIVTPSDSIQNKFNPISFDFQFNKIENGGYENQKARLLQIENFQEAEIK